MRQSTSRAVAPTGWGAALLLFLLCLPSVAGAACPASPDELRVVIDAAMEMYKGNQVGPFRESRDRARAEVACLDAVIPPLVAAAYHRLEAVDAAMVRDEQRAVLSFRSSLAVDPLFDITRIVAEGTFAFKAYDKARQTPPSARKDLELARRTVLWVDGVKITTQPTDRPVIVQSVDARGAMRWNVYLPAGASPPSETRPRVERLKVPFAVGTGVAAVGTAVLWTATMLQRAEAERVAEAIGDGETGVSLKPAFVACDAKGTGTGSEGILDYNTCTAAAYTDAYMTPVNNLGYAAQATSGLFLALGVATIGVSVRW